MACAQRGPMDVGSRADYADEGSTLTTSYEGQTPKIEMEKRGDRWFVTVYQGRQPSSGYAIRVERAIGVGTALRHRARFKTIVNELSSCGLSCPVARRGPHRVLTRTSRAASRGHARPRWRS